VEAAEAAPPALAHLLPAQQSAPWERLRSGQLLSGRQL
jgi:hypothetical protein